MEQQENTTINMKVSGVLRKFKAKPDGTEWTDEELDAGLADDYLYEVCKFEDGEVTSVWRKEE